MEGKGFNAEGDINLSEKRKAWWSTLGHETRKTIAEDEAVFMKQSMSTPCMNAVRSVEGCYIIDEDGKAYLDFHGNSLHQVGHKNPYVIEAIKRQLDELSFIPRRFTSDIAIMAAELLINQTTSKDYKVLFNPSGSGAIGMALKIARKVTGRHKVISMWEAFHGAGLDAISVGGEYIFKKDMVATMPGCIKAIPYNAYRNMIRSDEPDIVAKFCLDHIEYIIENEGEIGAILLEPVRATDIHIPPQSFFKRLRKICDKYGILLIFDEIPTALGRSGKFYVHQNFGVEPDILVLGKGLGGGIIPQAAVLVKKQYDCGEDISLGHYTHEKPALGCAAICATIDYIEQQNLLEHCNEMADYIKEKKEVMYSTYDCIGDIRQIGLLVTFEFVKDRGTKEKDEELAEKILYKCMEQGLSFKIAAGNCVTWHPPLVVTKEQLTIAFDMLEKAIKSVRK